MTENHTTRIRAKVAEEIMLSDLSISVRYTGVAASSWAGDKLGKSCPSLRYAMTTIPGIQLP